jgi:hypothetical protein
MSVLSAPVDNNHPKQMFCGISHPPAANATTIPHDTDGDLRPFPRDFGICHLISGNCAFPFGRPRFWAQLQTVEKLFPLGRGIADMPNQTGSFLGATDVEVAQPDAERQ